MLSMYRQPVLESETIFDCTVDHADSFAIEEDESIVDCRAILSPGQPQRRIDIYV